jgi:hypothetical protein
MSRIVVHGSRVAPRFHDCRYVLERNVLISKAVIIARVVVRFDHVASFIINANQLLDSFHYLLVTRIGAHRIQLGIILGPIHFF